jgi:hypothetical protein
LEGNGTGVIEMLSRLSLELKRSVDILDTVQAEVRCDDLHNTGL